MTTTPPKCFASNKSNHLATIPILAFLWTIFLDVIAPVLLVVGLGAALQRKFSLDIKTLAKLTVWTLVPSFLFYVIYKSDPEKVNWKVIGDVALANVVPMFLVGGITFFILRQLKVPGSAIAAMVLASVVVNAGNFGIPVAELAYEGSMKLKFEGMDDPAQGKEIQALCVMVSNLVLWCFGYTVLAVAKGDGIKNALFGYFKLPMIYAIVAAFVCRDHDIEPPAVLLYPLKLLKEATVPMMLLTLGAQLAKSARWPRWQYVAPVLIIKLIVLPAVTAAYVVMIGVWPWPGAQLVISAAAPAAVNVLLLTLELDGDAELAADCVFWTTIFSAITATVVLAIVAGFGVVA